MSATAEVAAVAANTAEAPGASYANIARGGEEPNSDVVIIAEEVKVGPRG